MTNIPFQSRILVVHHLSPLVICGEGPTDNTCYSQQALHVFPPDFLLMVFTAVARIGIPL